MSSSFWSDAYSLAWMTLDEIQNAMVDFYTALEEYNDEYLYQGIMDYSL